MNEDSKTAADHWSLPLWMNTVDIDVVHTL